MFLAFLLRGLSFPAHEFLRGLLFVYGVQLHQLTPNSILHIACFMTLYESFLGIEPHFLLWKFLFRLRPSVTLSKKPELGGAVISIRAESHYLEFSMAALVQGWRKKWFYIKYWKVSSSDQYDIAPFDASKEVQKLTSWDSPPTEAEMEEIKLLLARIQALKSGKGGALSGTQLMAFFQQRRVQPLQHRLSKLWSYSGLGDSSRVSDDLMEKKDLDKRVRALSTLTKDYEVADLAARYFNSEHPLPAVCILSSFYSSYFYFSVVFLTIVDLFSFQDHQPLASRPPLPEGGALQDVPIFAAFEAPEAKDSQEGDEAKDSLEGTSSTTSPPPALSEDLGRDKKRKRVMELLSSSTSAHKNVTGETSMPEEEVELFDLLDS
jgi:hypothetical protein